MALEAEATKPTDPGKLSNAWGLWFGRAALVLVPLMAVVALYQLFIPVEPQIGLTKTAYYHKRAEVLAKESDPIKRDSMCIPLSAFGRSIDAQLATNARVFVLEMTGDANKGKLGYLYFLQYYLFPREVAISAGQSPRYTLAGMEGRQPASLEELKTAGYDLVLHQAPDGRWQSQMLSNMQSRSPQTSVKPIPPFDGIIAFLLPLATALAGMRLLRLLFRDLEGTLSLGEWLACGLAVGTFLATQGILGLRLAGLRLEYPLAMALMIWGAVELVLLVRNRWKSGVKPDKQQLWWLLAIPAILLLWPLFRLAGLEGLSEFDAVAFWSFKAKLFHECAGDELWKWLKNPGIGYAHLDYPLIASLVQSFTYGAIGHVNEFVTKFWNQWFLLLLGWAVLGAAQFPRRIPWVSAAAATALVALPLTLDFTLKEGGTIPMTFFAATASLQLALGMAEHQAGRIRLGLLLLMATAMVKFEGIIILAMWGGLVLLDRNSRSALWPVKPLLWPVLTGFAGWLPYIIFRLKGPVLHPESGFIGALLQHIPEVIQIAPMTIIGFLSRRFLNNDFASWAVTDNHAAWNGKWTGFGSLIDQSTLGVAWLCVLTLLFLWWRGGAVRWTAVRLCLVFFAFGAAIGLVWCSKHTSPLDLLGAMEGSIGINGGRYLHPVLMSWFLGSVVLMARHFSPRPKE